METSESPEIPAVAHLTKAEAAELLGKSTRTITNYVSQGRLAVAYFNGPTGTQAVFNREEVERFKIALETPVPGAAAPVLQNCHTAGDTALAVRDNGKLAGANLAELISYFEWLRAQNAPPAVKPWLTLAEAVEYSGLPRTYLLREACNRRSQHFAVNVSGGLQPVWRFSRVALDGQAGK